MSFEKFIYKKKKEISFHLLPFLTFGLHGLFPAAQHQPQPGSPPLFPARPFLALTQLPSPPLLQQPPPLRPLGPAGPAPPARNAPAHLARNCRRAFLSPSAADSLAPAVRAFPHLRTSRACAQP